MSTQESSPADDSPAERGEVNEDPPRSSSSIRDAPPVDDAPPIDDVPPGEPPPEHGPAGTTPPDDAASDPKGSPWTPPTTDNETDADAKPRIPPHAQFADRQRPQRYAQARSTHHPTTPLDPIRPYIAGPVPRRRRSDIPVLVFALIVSAVVMAACCLAGFGIFRTYGL